MSFEELQAKVARAEAALEARERETAADFRVFGGIWRDGWTPPRIIVAGLAGGFLMGWLRPGRTIAGAEPARWLQLMGSIAGLVGSVQAAFAAGQAQEAAADAGDAARAPGATVGQAPAAATAARPPAAADRARRQDPAWDAPPRPAEAATELSEHR
ncbi:protein sip-5 [Luteimonas granuli]|uniref:Protein sip-5 n=1 Tax=Luteimonas granuli TaxID=1176533 RepID=A0A518N4Z7_9GAMM|nr:protein sip-5 [Luteimonas granuli]QDW66989.1 protein sip-5 [Luteimonas granuli]